jgi:hypothetical protein
VRTVTEYLLKAVEFDDLASFAPEDALKKRYADLAECYRLLAQERKRLIPSDTPPPPSGS